MGWVPGDIVVLQHDVASTGIYSGPYSLGSPTFEAVFHKDDMALVVTTHGRHDLYVMCGSRLGWVNGTWMCKVTK